MRGKKILREKDIKRILKNYRFGDLISLRKIERRLETLQPSFVLKTTEGKFFLKQYREFDSSKKKGLEFNLLLQRNGYPCNKVLVNTKGKPFSKYEGTTISIFEYLPYKSKTNLNNKECFKYGKWLAKLHFLSKKFENSIKEKYTPNYFYNNFRKQYKLTEKAPKRIRSDLKRIKEEYQKAVKALKGLPKGICHTEYTPEHIRFHNNELVAVIDWDLVTRSYYLYDVGTALSVFVNENQVDFEKIKTFLKGYESIRKLKKEERGSLYEAIELGIFKFITWGLDEDEIENNGWESIGTPAAIELMELDKEKANQKLREPDN